MGSRRGVTCRCRSPSSWSVLALVISFAILIFAWHKPRFHHVGGHRLPGLTAVLDHPIVRLIARPAGAGHLRLGGLATIAGRDLLTNPIFGFVFVWMSGRPGTDLAAIRPVLARHQPFADDPLGLIPLPAGIGVWPAAVCLFGFGWLELVQLGPNHAGTAALGAGLVGDLGGRTRSCSARAGSAQQIRWKSIVSTLAEMSIFLGLRAGC